MEKEEEEERGNAFLRWEKGMESFQGLSRVEELWEKGK